jgi:hypothetical protein
MFTRICVFVPEIQLQFNHFLIKDDEPLLDHAGLKKCSRFYKTQLARC